MKFLPRLLILSATLIFQGCAINRPLGTFKHSDGSGETTYRYLGAGGLVRPGIGVIIADTKGSNAPLVVTTASGPPMGPAVISGGAFAGALVGAGAAIRPDETEVHTSATGTGGGGGTGGAGGAGGSATATAGKDGDHRSKDRPPSNRPPSNRPPAKSPKDR